MLASSSKGESSPGCTSRFRRRCDATHPTRSLVRRIAATVGWARLANDNLVSQLKNVNLSKYTLLEEEWARALNSGVQNRRPAVRFPHDPQLLDGFEMTEITSFEDLLADAQSEMIAVSLEYSEGEASEILIFATADGGMFTFDPFFVVNGSVVERHKLSGVDTSLDRQRALLKYGNAQLIRLAEGSTSFGRPLPTLFTLRFNVSSRSLDAEYSYEPLCEGAPTTTPLSLREDWQREIQAGL